MNKHPLDYKKEDLKKIMFKPAIISVGPRNQEIVTETLEGTIIECGLAGNSPHLPADIQFRLLNGEVRRYDFFELKQISIR